MKSNILIVDDNVKNIQLAANVIKSTELYNIYFATSGQKALDQLKLRPYSLILLDINMPELDGYETARLIKSNEKTREYPIIFLSANANKESIRKGFECGGEDYITKPFDELELIHRVKTNVELFNIRQALQSEVDETKTLLEQYKEAVDVGSLVSKTDPYGVITYVNDKFCEVSKYTREELIGKNHNIIRSPDVSPDIFKNLWDTIKAKKTWSGLLKNRAKDGSAYFVESTIKPILNNSGEIIEYIGIRTDITNEIKLREDIVDTQKEVLHTLGELGEWRSRETGDHVNRVSLFSEILARSYGYSEHDTELLKMASPMHDIGKVIIPDNILLKNGKLTVDEFEVMKKHTSYGWEIFNKSRHELLRAAALIAHEHHEKWDGSGYPNGLKGEDIHIYGRITSIADVFDALTSKRIYKEAWNIDDAVAYIKNESGKSFEPRLVELLCENLNDIVRIRKLYSR